MKNEDALYLKTAFKDLLNYDAENIFDEIDPLSYSYRSIKRRYSCNQVTHRRGIRFEQKRRYELYATSYCI
jgi:hypothetical protein